MLSEWKEYGLSFLVIQRSLHEAREDWVRSVWLGEELGVELGGDVEGVLRKLNDFYQAFVGGDR